MYRSLRRLAGVVVVLACLPAADAQALDGAGYLALADRLQRHLDPFWNESLGRYHPGPGATTTQVNGNLLLVHALAARHGHAGPARAGRARAPHRPLPDRAGRVDRAPTR